MVVLCLGLLSRYVLGQKRLGMGLLYCVPLIDLILLVATAFDLHSGTVANFFHGLAAAYLGFTIAFGRGMVQWADERFAFRFADGPEPQKAPAFGEEAIRYEWQLWFRALGACLITCILILLAILYVGDTDKTEALVSWLPNMAFFVLLPWLIFGPLWVRVFPKKKPEQS